MDTPSATPQRHWPPAWHVTVVDETGSTNDDLLRAAAAGAPDRTVLVARHQTAGRGRLDRRWDAEPGSNLLVSLLFREVPAHPQVLMQRLALATAIACERTAGAHPLLKWPNDLLLDGAKLAGVLAQVHSGSSGPAVVVGLGLNVGWAPEGAAMLGPAIDPLDVLEEMLLAFDGLPDDVFALHRERLATRGREVRVQLADGDVEGRALDVEPDGRLVVLDTCGVTHRFDAGDVVHVR